MSGGTFDWINHVVDGEEITGLECAVGLEVDVEVVAEGGVDDLLDHHTADDDGLSAGGHEHSGRRQTRNKAPVSGIAFMGITAFRGEEEERDE